MKNLLTLIFLVISFSLSAQKISGFYSGTMYNDTTKMVQKYELAINEYRGKITGYSYVTFIAKDTFYWGIRKVKAEIVGDSLVVMDDKIIANNFPEKPAKGVGRIITIPLKGQDSLVNINGTWKTNKTKRYYSVPGSLALDRSTDSASSPLIRHLQELNIIPAPVYAATAVSDKKENKTNPVAKVNKSKPRNDMISKPVAENTENVITNPVPLNYAMRQNKLLQTFDITADSLVIAFYDNGVVDGDSISVFANGVNIVLAERLKTVATKKVIRMDAPEVELLLVAENMGTIPPNTGLLTITDSDQQYQIHFSADMQTNASIILRRKKKN